MIGRDPTSVGQRVARRLCAGGPREECSPEGRVIAVRPRKGHKQITVIWDGTWAPLLLDSVNLIVIGHELLKEENR